MKSKLFPHFLAFLTVFFWGLTFLSTKHLEDTLTAFEILFIRYFIAYFALWAAYPKRLPVKNIKEEGMFFLCGITGATVYQYLENLSISYTNASSVSFIVGTAPFFTALLAFFVLKEKLGLSRIFGMFVSIGGIFLICFGDSLSEGTGLTGDLIMLSGVILWAIYSIAIKKVSAWGYSDVLVTRRIFFYSVVVMIPFMIPKLGSLPYADIVRPDIGLNLLFLAIIASALCFATWNTAVKELGPTVTATYLFISPIITLLAEIILTDKKATVPALIGMALTLIGLFIAEFGGKLKKKKA